MLTGTTIHNRFEDVTNLVRILRVEQPKWGNVDEVREFKENVYYRLTQVECQSNIHLPTKSLNEHYLKMEETQQAEYQQLLGDVAQMYEAYRLGSSAPYIPP